MKKKREAPERLHVKKGDTVIILSGKDRGKAGEITAAYPTTGKVAVAGLNLVTRHQKARRDTPFGQMQQGLVEKPAALFVGKVMLQCPHCGRGTRIHRTVQADGSRIRVCKKCSKDID